MALPKDFKQEVGLSKYIMQSVKSGNKVKFRVLSDFITGKCVWGEPEGKRVCTRVRTGEAIPVAAIGFNEKQGRPEPIRQFLAAVVYNYATDQVEIFETDKSTIIGQIVEIESNDDWGDSKNFDLSISKTGEGMETKYSVLPSPGKLTKKVDWSGVNLEALFSGGDPFEEVSADSNLAEDVADEIPF